MVCELRQARFGYLLSLHILLLCAQGRTPTEIAAFLFCSRSSVYRVVAAYRRGELDLGGTDRKSTRLNSSHANISYAVFCLKTKRVVRFHFNGVLRSGRRHSHHCAL